MTTQLGFGDTATWGRCDGHPHDPRTDADDAGTSLQPLGDAKVMVQFSNDAGVYIIGAEIGGEWVDRDSFSLMTLQAWKQAIQAEQGSDLAAFLESQQ